MEQQEFLEKNVFTNLKNLNTEFDLIKINKLFCLSPQYNL